MPSTILPDDFRCESFSKQASTCSHAPRPCQPTGSSWPSTCILRRSLTPSSCPPLVRPGCEYRFEYRRYDQQRHAHQSKSNYLEHIGLCDDLLNLYLLVPKLQNKNYVVKLISQFVLDVLLNNLVQIVRTSESLQ